MDHMWVSMSYTPIIVEPNADGSLVVSVSDAAGEVAKEEALLGCWFCYTPLNAESFNTKCDPESSQKIIEAKFKNNDLEP